MWNYSLSVLQTLECCNERFTITSRNVSTSDSLNADVTHFRVTSQLYSRTCDWRRICSQWTSATTRGSDCIRKWETTWSNVFPGKGESIGDCSEWNIVGWRKGFWFVRRKISMQVSKNTVLSLSLSLSLSLPLSTCCKYDGVSTNSSDWSIRVMLTDNGAPI